MNPADTAVTRTPAAFAQELQRVNHYAKFDREKGRREFWPETVDRFMAYFQDLLDRQGAYLRPSTVAQIRSHILSKEVMPSMRGLAQAGASAARNGIEIYNCAYAPVKDWYVLVETLMISMSGCGMGFSVEDRYVSQWPVVPKISYDRPRRFLVEDSTEGWAHALEGALRNWLEFGVDTLFDTSLIRPEGSDLRTKGGKASGPRPFENMISSLREIFREAQGRRLTSLELFDAMCLVGDCAVSGGKRRTAMIALFDKNDSLMMNAKNYGFWVKTPHRANANVSVVYRDGTTDEELAAHLRHLHDEKTGEPGFFFRDNARKNQFHFREDGELGTNPCGEIVLQEFQFCNLSSVVCKAEDTLASLALKVRLATIVGLVQSLETNFPVLREEWKRNAIKERLLGVDLNNQMSCPLVQKENTLRVLREIANGTAEEYAQLFKIQRPAAVCTVKPSGNSAMFLGAASGLHAWWSEYFVRRFTLQDKNPVTTLVRDSGVPMVESPYNVPGRPKAWLAEVPLKVPDSATVDGALSAIDKLEYWLRVKTCWAKEHNPSVTVTYQDSELEEVIAWMQAHKHEVGGITFLLKEDHVLPSPPYETIGREEYERRAAAWPTVDFGLLTFLEGGEDNTTASRELACTANGCETA